MEWRANVSLQKNMYLVMIVHEDKTTVLLWCVPTYMTRKQIDVYGLIEITGIMHIKLTTLSSGRKEIIRTYGCCGKKPFSLFMVGFFGGVDGQKMYI